MIDTVIYLVSFFMFLGFPIWYWPKMIDISSKRVAVALTGGLGVWIVLLVVLSPLIVDLPEM